MLTSIARFYLTRPYQDLRITIQPNQPLPRTCRSRPIPPHIPSDSTGYNQCPITLRGKSFSTTIIKADFSGPINPKFLQPGITGADLTLPIFDGTSANPHDHLIDLDTPSMESCPDVRVYFALVGSVITKDNLSPPKDHAERVLSDARLVRQGREYLKAARDRGDG
jgi:hypothetical protein